MRLKGMFSRRFPAALAVLGACAAFAAALAVAVPRASAVEPFPVGATTLQTDHFLIHYSGDPANSAYIQQQKAGDTAAGRSARTPSTVAGATRRRSTTAMG